MSARRVLVGRREGAGSDLESLLAAAGLAPVLAPLIKIVPPVESGPLREAVARLQAGDYDWVAFTSVPAVQAVLEVTAGRSDRAGGVAAGRLADEAPAWAARVAAVGPGTRAALASAGVAVSLAPDSAGSAEELSTAWPAGAGAVLLPRSEIASSVLPDALRAKGYDVDEVTAYRTVEVPLDPECASDLRAGGFAAVVLTSGSAARSLARYPIATSTTVVAIGRSTAEAASAAGLTIAAVAAEPTAAALVAAVQLATDGPPPDPTIGPYPRSRTMPERSTGRQK